MMAQGIFISPAFWTKQLLIRGAFQLHHRYGLTRFQFNLPEIGPFARNGESGYLVRNGNVPGMVTAAKYDAEALQILHKPLAILWSHKTDRANSLSLQSV